MELVVKKNDLLRELQLFQGIVERKNTIPILANVLMEARSNEIRLLATDLEVGLRSRCEAAVEKPGSLTLPAKKLYEIVRALPETDVRISEDKNGVKVAADRFESRMKRFARFSLARRSGNWGSCCRRATATFSTSGVRTTCFSVSASAC
jgi:DNA polymerase-3 subunit beta